jgi:iron complex transport system ATP-binding protein
VSAGVRVQGLSVAYGRRRVLGPVDFSIEPNRVVAFAGENGSGKSTLLKAVAGLASASGGVFFDGRPLHELGRRELSRTVAYAPQSVGLVFPITVEDLVLQGRAPWRAGWLWESSRDREIAREAMRDCDIEGLADRDATKISGGERRRAFLARLLAQRAPVWLLDEPTADLDPRHRMEFLSIVRAAHRERRATVFWATHDLDDALAFADDAVLLRAGRVVAAGSIAESLSPDRLEEAYGVPAWVEPDSRGRRRVFFSSPLSGDRIS